MYETFLATLAPMLVMFCCLLVGFALNKLKLMPENAGTVLSRLETYALVPAVSLSSFMKYCTARNLQTYSSTMFYGAIAILVAIIIAIPLSYIFKIKDTYKRGIYQYALAFGNFGFMGNAIVPMILGGEEHLFVYLLFTLPLSVAIYVWGITILTPKEARKNSVIKNLFNFPLIMIFVGAALGLTGLGTRLPGFLTTTIDSLSACMGPIGMILTGFIIGQYRIGELFKDVRVYIASALRLLVLPAILVAALWLFKADTYTLAFALFAFATPLGMNTVVFPAAFGGETKTGASMAMISTAFSVLTIPFMYALFMLLF